MMRSRTQRTWGPSARLARGSIPPPDRGDWLADAVRSQFPRLAAALGDTSFELLFAAFAATEPEAEHSLAASQRFPEYLARTAVFPAWYGELAALDRARAAVLHAPVVTPLARRDFLTDTTLRLVPAHAFVWLTTSVDELSQSLDEGRTPAAAPRPLESPRLLLIWCSDGETRDRVVDPAEVDALRAASRGTSLAELSAVFTHARALELVLRWLDDRVLSCQTVRGG